MRWVNVAPLRFGWVGWFSVSSVVLGGWGVISRPVVWCMPSGKLGRCEGFFQTFVLFFYSFCVLAIATQRDTRAEKTGWHQPTEAQTGVLSWRFPPLVLTRLWRIQAWPVTILTVATTSMAGSFPSWYADMKHVSRVTLSTSPFLHLKLLPDQGLRALLISSSPG